MGGSKDPLVSIVIPVYSGEAYLLECIESVLRRTYSNREYVLVDHWQESALSVAQLRHWYSAMDAHPRAVATVHEPTLGTVFRREGSGILPPVERGPAQREETRKYLNQLSESRAIARL